jgi:hypothetical protein
VSGGQWQLKGGHQARVHSDQMVLMMVRQGGWNTVRRWPKVLKIKISSRGTTRLMPVRSDGSCGTVVRRRLDPGCPVAKNAQMRIGKQL